MKRKRDSCRQLGQLRLSILWSYDEELKIDKFSHLDSWTWSLCTQKKKSEILFVHNQYMEYSQFLGSRSIVGVERLRIGCHDFEERGLPSGDRSPAGRRRWAQTEGLRLRIQKQLSKLWRRILFKAAHGQKSTAILYVYRQLFLDTAWWLEIFSSRLVDKTFLIADSWTMKVKLKLSRKSRCYNQALTACLYLSCMLGCILSSSVQKQGENNLDPALQENVDTSLDRGIHLHKMYKHVKVMHHAVLLSFLLLYQLLIPPCLVPKCSLDMCNMIVFYRPDVRGRKSVDRCHEASMPC